MGKQQSSPTLAAAALQNYNLGYNQLTDFKLNIANFGINSREVNFWNLQDNSPAHIAYSSKLSKNFIT